MRRFNPAQAPITYSLSQAGLSQAGVALLEVLIVFIVLSIGLLGMAALQLKSVQYTQSAYMRSQAVVAVGDVLDRIRLNGGQAGGGDPDADDFQPNSPAADDYEAWRTFVSEVLPNGLGDVTCAAEICTVTISWDDRFDDGNIDGDGNISVRKTMAVDARM